MGISWRSGFRFFLKRIGYRALALLSPDFRRKTRHNEAIAAYIGQWLVLGGVVVLVAFIALCFAANGVDDFILKFMATLGGVFTIVLGVIQSAATAENKRMGTVDVFLSDILSICSVMYSFRLPQCYTELYKNPTTLLGHLTPGEEDYTSVHRDHCSELVALDYEVVRQVTAFYRYFLGSRDAAQQLTGWDSMPPAARQDAVQSVMIQLHLCLSRAREAVAALADGEQVSGMGVIDEMLTVCEAFYSQPGTDVALAERLHLTSQPAAELAYS